MWKRGKLLRRFVILFFAAFGSGFEGGNVGGGLKLLQRGFDFLHFSRQILRFDAVFARHAHQFAQALFLCGQFGRIEVAAGGYVAHVGGHFAQFGFDAGQKVQAFVEARLYAAEGFEFFLAAVDLRLQAVVAVDGFFGFLCGFHQFGGVGEAVVALADGFPFAGRGGEAAEFVKLPFQPFAFDLQVFALSLGGLQGLVGVLPALVGGFDFARQRGAAGKGIQQFALRGFLVERVVGVLAVNVDQAAAYAFQLRQGGGLVVDVAAAFSFGIDDAADGEFFRIFRQQSLFAQFGLQFGQFGKVEQGGEACFCRALPDLAVVGLVAQQQADGVEGDGFSGAGFAGQYGETGLEVEVESVYDDEVVERKCQQHGESFGCRGRRLYRGSGRETTVCLSCAVAAGAKAV